MTVASLGDRFPMSLRQFFRGQEVRSKRRDPRIQRYSVMYQKTRILVCLFPVFSKALCCIFGLCSLVTPVATHQVVCVSQLLRLLVANVATSGR